VRSNESRDILSNRMLAGAVFWLPALVLLASGFFDIGQGWRTAIWVVALTTMGAACIANAIRCGRVHCYATGPFFLIMAIVALTYGLGLTPMGKHGWNLIGLTVLVGAIVLCCLPETFLGRYRRGRTTGQR
jgi:peptidoglycan/LPS O-acetylase OafA/YrhL